jgi:nucleotide-binding universal stress UspA family protein
MVTAQLTPIGVGIHSVLIATDFSRYSNQALHVGLKLAKGYGAQAYVVMVVPSDEFMLAGPEAYVAAKDAARRDLEGLKVELQQKQCCQEGKDYHLYLLEGDVAQSILSFSHQKHIDLIVVGTHGRGGLGKALMGSVAEKVFRGSTVPVLTIGPCVRHANHALAPKNILVAADFTPASERAAQFAAGMAMQHHANLTLLHVLSPKDIEHVPDQARVIQEVESRLTGLLGDELTLPCSARVETGRVGPTILQMATEIQADLIVMGVRPPMGVLNRFLWPNAYEIVCESPCPVLTVRERIQT